MDLFFTVGNIVIGIILTLIGFKIINPFKNNPEFEEKWNKKYANLFKIIGIILILFGVIKLII